MLSILVVGATGKQGSAVVHSFLSSSTEPVSIHALTRSATSPGALALAKQGVTLHAGSLEDSASLVAALQGREAAFLFTTQEPGEVERGRRFIEAAKEAGVKRIVFSSVQGAQARTGVPHWETKAEIEELVKTSGLRWTILRPAMFYENFPKVSGGKSFLFLGLFAAAVGASKPLDLISVADIGHFAAQALLQPADYEGRIIALAGDRLSIKELQATYTKVQGRDAWRAYIPSLLLGALPADMNAMLKYMKKDESKIDTESLRSEYRGLLSFADWLQRSD